MFNALLLSIHSSTYFVPDLLPWHGHILEQLEDGMGHVLEGAQVNSFVVAILPTRKYQ